MAELIPISRPSITQLEIGAVTDAVTSQWVSSLGPYITKFEQGFAEFCGVQHGVSVSNGTNAIQLALAAFDIGRGDEVIVPDLTFVATANAVLHTGATPVFVDVEPDNHCLDPAQLEAAITSRTRAVIPVHLYGHPADMDAINAIAAKHELVVIEDAAEAHGALYKGARVGGLGHCATFSFYGNKNMTTGEGGMITTNDRTLDERCRLLRDHAMSPTKRYWHTEAGYNFRMTNLQAAMGCAQLQRLDEFLAKRRQIFQWYRERLADQPELTLNFTSPWAENCYWLVNVELADADCNLRDAIMADMREEGVDSRPYFYPMSHLPYFETAATPVSAAVSARGLSLPTFFDLQEEDVDRVCKALIAAVGRRRATADDLAVARQSSPARQ